MGTLAAAAVVLVAFPFSDPAPERLRPAVVLVNTESGDWILCPITGDPYDDPNAIQLGEGDLSEGMLQRGSYIHPTRLFTTRDVLVHRVIGRLRDEVFYRALIGAIAALLKGARGTA